MSTDKDFESLAHFTHNLRNGFHNAGREGLGKLKSDVHEAGHAWLDGFFENIFNQPSTSA
jgi:hypothetical protein